MIPGEADPEDLATPKRKRSDDNWRTARSVQSALKRESAALKNQARSQAQAKMIGHELYKANKTHRQAALKAEEEIGNLHERHRRVVLQAEEEIGKLNERHHADIADLNKRHREDVAAHHDLEESLADTKQELVATKKELQYSLSNRRIQGELHMKSMKRQSQNHHADLERVQTEGQATIRELKASLFLFSVLIFLTSFFAHCLVFHQSEHYLAHRNQEKEITKLNSQLSSAHHQLDLTISDQEYHIAVAVKETKRDERVHFNKLLLEKKSLIDSLLQKNTTSEQRRMVTAYQFFVLVLVCSCAPYQFFVLVLVCSCSWCCCFVLLFLLVPVVVLMPVLLLVLFALYRCLCCCSCW